MSSSASDFLMASKTLHRSLLAIWTQYQEAGVGSINEQLYERFSSAVDNVQSVLESERSDESSPSRDEFENHLKVATKLTRMCAKTPQGLSFVTGEAGLIPRRDLHDQMQAAVDFFSRFVEDTQSEHLNE